MSDVQPNYLYVTVSLVTGNLQNSDYSFVCENIVRLNDTEQVRQSCHKLSFQAVTCCVKLAFKLTYILISDIDGISTG